MFFSILIPVYNTITYLPDCMESLLSQTEKDLEIVLLDDGSTDGSGDLCDRYAAQYPFVRVIHKENEGLMMTRRRGFQEARGEYCVCIDSDDYLCDPNALATVRQRIERDRCDMVFYEYIYGSEDRENDRHITLFDRPDGFIFEGEGKKELYEKILVGGFFNNIWIKVVRRDRVDTDVDYSVWKQDICRGEDYFQVFPMLTNAQRIGYIKQPFYYYRWTPGSISNSPKLRYYNAFRRIYLRENEYVDRWTADPAVKKQVKKKRIAVILGIVTVGCKKSKTREQKREWRHFAKWIGQDDFFDSVYRTVMHSDTLLYYKVLCYLIRHRMPRLTAFTIGITDRISAVRHKK